MCGFELYTHNCFRWVLYLSMYMYFLRIKIFVGSKHFSEKGFKIILPKLSHARICINFNEINQYNTHRIDVK